MVGFEASNETLNTVPKMVPSQLENTYLYCAAKIPNFLNVFKVSKKVNSKGGLLVYALLTESTFNCSKSIMKTPEQCVYFVQS